MVITLGSYPCEVGSIPSIATRISPKCRDYGEKEEKR